AGTTANRARSKSANGAAPASAATATPISAGPAPRNAPSAGAVCRKSKTGTGFMSGIRVVGIIIAIIGAVVLYIGLNASHSLVDRASEALTGRYTQETMVYSIVGIVALVGGGLTALVARR